MSGELRFGNAAGKWSAVLRAAGIAAIAASFCVLCSDFVVGGNDDLGGGGGGRGNDISNYNTVQIGGLWWMAENLDYAIRGSACPDSSLDNCQSFGRLYTWEAAMKACPDLGMGWHLPDTSEWNSLESALGGRQTAGADTFFIPPGGYGRGDGTFDDLSNGYWWSSTSYNSAIAWYRFTYSKNDFLYENSNEKRIMYSVRCVN